MNRRGILWVVILLVVIAGFVVVGRGSRLSDEPLDPNGVGDGGLRAVLELARSYGAEVDLGRGLPTGEHTIALLVADTLSDEARADVREWVARGGTLVVTDTSSSFVPKLGGAFGTGAGITETVRPGQCDVRALRNVQELDVGGGEIFATPQLYRVRPGDSRCFTLGPDAFLVVTPQDRGHVVALGSAAPFTNERIDNADNAVLAVDLLAPSRDAKLLFLRPLIEGGESLSDLIRSGVKFGFLQSMIAFLFYALYRARRLGRPIIEDPPIRIASSDLTIAVGNLLARSGSAAHTAERLRHETRRRISRRLGLPADAPAEQLAQAVGGRTSIDPVTAAQLLGPTAVTSDQQLVALAEGLHRIEEEILR